MEYELLAAFPAITIVLIALSAVTIKLTFRRQQPLKISRGPKVSSQGLQVNKKTLQARYHRTRSIFIFVGVSAAAVWLMWQIWTLSHPVITPFKPFYILFGGYTLVQFFIASFVRPFNTRTDAQDSILNSLKTAVIVPVYNEDAAAIKRGLGSLMTQTRLPQEIHVVDDGSSVEYAETEKWLKQTAKKYGIKATWTRQSNSGKRAAQIKAFSKINKRSIDIVITVDSDCELDPHAIQEGLKPFATNRDIQSVAGVVIAKNAQHNILARITDLIFVSGQQLIDRASMSAFGSVIVNSGGLALYRKQVLQNAIDNDYDNEYFASRKVTFSDDSYLTLIALKMGKTVQQPSAIVFTDMPVNVSHHARQQMRWSRGSFIRGWWRLRYLPIISAGWLRQVLGWMIFGSISMVQISLFLVIPLLYNVMPSLYLLIIPILFMYLISLRYFTVQRSDMTLQSQLLTFAMAPLAVLWSGTVLRTIRLYAMLTCMKTGWGTRESVEIVYGKSGEAGELAAPAS